MFGLRDLLLLAPSSTSLDISQPIFSHHLNNTTTTTTTNNNNNTVGVIPLLPATYLEDTNFDGNSRETRMRLWSQSQSQQQAQQTNQNQQSQQQHHKRPMDNSGGSGALVPIFINNSGSSNNTSCSISGIACQDCGNQAKKDCSYRRCRTCCKSRAFDCSTHIKSTWVPASRRRERQQQQQQQQHQEQNQEQSQLFTKKPRTSQTTSHTSTSGTRSFDSTQQDSPLPGQVRAPAVFKCVRVTSIDDGDDEFAYQATVKIGGRVFKGFLYDQGVDGGGEGIPNLSDLHLGAAVSSSSSPPVIDPSSSHVYGGGMMGGSGYENQMN